jgi:hypothetical protein
MATMDNNSYERPTIEDYGTLSDLTAGLQVKGPEDALEKGVKAHGNPPGHSSPTGPPSGK